MGNFQSATLKPTHLEMPEQEGKDQTNAEAHPPSHEEEGSTS